MQAGEWALLIVLALLAFAGLYYLYWRYAASPPYVLLPTITSKLCKHSGNKEPHYLAYITAEEHKMLVNKKGLGLRKAGTQGVPCYPVHTPPPSPSAKRRKKTNEAPPIHPKPDWDRILDGYGAPYIPIAPILPQDAVE